MKITLLTHAALLTLMTVGYSTVLQAQEKERCFGVSAAGKNSCGNLSGTHSCAGQSKIDNGVDEWTYLPKGECAKKNGFTKAEAEREVKRRAAGLNQKSTNN